MQNRKTVMFDNIPLGMYFGLGIGCGYGFWSAMLNLVVNELNTSRLEEFSNGDDYTRYELTLIAGVIALCGGVGAIIGGMGVGIYNVMPSPHTLFRDQKNSKIFNTAPFWSSSQTPDYMPQQQIPKEYQLPRSQQSSIQNEETDYYKDLGVPRDASMDKIKKVYREKAKQCHPDKVSGKEDLFKKITEAYEILSIASKRAVYDYDNPNAGKLDNANMRRRMR